MTKKLVLESQYVLANSDKELRRRLWVLAEAGWQRLGVIQHVPTNHLYALNPVVGDCWVYSPKLGAVSIQMMVRFTS